MKEKWPSSPTPNRNVSWILVDFCWEIFSFCPTWSKIFGNLQTQLDLQNFTRTFLNFNWLQLDLSSRRLVLKKTVRLPALLFWVPFWLPLPPFRSRPGRRWKYFERSKLLDVLFKNIVHTCAYYYVLLTYADAVYLKSQTGANSWHTSGCEWLTVTADRADCHLQIWCFWVSFRSDERFFFFFCGDWATSSTYGWQSAGVQTSDSVSIFLFWRSGRRTWDGNSPTSFRFQKKKLPRICRMLDQSQQIRWCWWHREASTWNITFRNMFVNSQFSLTNCDQFAKLEKNTFCSLLTSRSIILT